MAEVVAVPSGVTPFAVSKRTKVPPLKQIQRKPPVIRCIRSENRHGKQTQKSVETVVRIVNGRRRDTGHGTRDTH